MAVPLHSDSDVPPPRHVAIIMDGNGRWAAARGLPRTAGHRRGADAVKRTVKAAGELGISYLTLFGFSSENWKRPVREIDDLMGLLRRYLRSEADELARNNVRIRVIGDRSALARDIVTLIEGIEARTAPNTGLQLTVALSYGSRQELTAAFRRLAQDIASGKLSPENIDEALIGQSLTTVGIPDPDLLVRTSGEQRLSNFLLWQLAYTELVFLDVLWPDFDKRHLADAIHEYCGRERRYGAQAAP
ncbi:MAG: isoprenyl transferase [Alphaproteobacteria bacterium]